MVVYFEAVADYGGLEEDCVGGGGDVDVVFVVDQELVLELEGHASEGGGVV